MALNTQNTDAISFKKLSGKAHTQQNFAVNEESIASNVQLSYSTIFGDSIVPLPVTSSGLTNPYDTNGVVERVKFQVDLIPDTQIAVGRSQGYRLKLPSDYSTYGELRAYYASGTYLNTSLGKLQIVPPLYGTVKSDGSTEYDPILYQTNGSTIITKFDSINWYLDMYNGVLFVQDPPSGYDVSAARPGFVEAFLYVGQYLNDIVDVIQSGSTGGTTGNNVGGGVQVFKDKIIETLNFRTLIGVSGMSVTQTTNNIFLAYTGATGGGGDGTITGATNGLTVSGKNIKLGGDITGLTTISDSVGYGIHFGDDQGNSFLGSFNVLNLGDINLRTNNQLRLVSDVMYVMGNNMQVSGDTGFEGLKYYADYGAYFLPRSIPDVAWVTGYTASASPNIGAGNGLTKIGNSIVFGGDFTGNTSIGASGAYKLTIGDLSGTGPLSGFELNALTGMSINSIAGLLQINSNSGINIAATSGELNVSTTGKLHIESNGGNVELNSIGGNIGVTGNSIYHKTYTTYTISGATGFGGARYASNYATDFNARSLVDGAFVTGLTTALITSANNGITKTGTNFRLGGTFTGSTTLSGATTLNIINNTIEIGNNTSNSLLVQRFAYTIGTGFPVSTNYGGGAIQSDGKVILGGGFTSYNGITANRIVRLNYDGTLDPTFNSGTGLFGSGIAGKTIIAQADSKIMVGGTFTTYNSVTVNRIVRLLSNGTQDSSFVTGTAFDNSVDCIIQQPDGKYVVCGSFSSYSGVTANRLIRLNVNGSVDSTFSAGSGFSGGNSPSSLALQSDGKIIIVGGFTTYNGTTGLSNVLRINADGTYDSSFTPLAFNNSISGVIVQPDGKIILHGIFTTYNATTQRFAIRLNSNGSKDTSFVPQFTNGNQVGAMALQPDGKIIAAGDFTQYNSLSTNANRIVRLNSNGSHDQSFNSGTGLGGTFIGNGLTAILLESNGSGRMVLFGSFTQYNGLSRNRVIKVDQYGSALGNTLITLRPAEYTTDMSAIYNNRSLVDKGFVIAAIASSLTGATVNKKKVEIVTATSVTATTESNFIGCSGSTANVYLPANPALGQEIIVTDVQGDGLTNPITIYGNGKLLDGDTSAEINSDYGTITFLYNGITWSIIAYAA